VWWRGDRNSESVKIIGMAVTALAARSGLRLHDSGCARACAFVDALAYDSI
jgi:hypothetical protein